MSILQLSLAILCVLAISIGQVLFKRVGIDIEALGGWVHFRILMIFAIACLLYGGATLIWIHLLRSVDLIRIYPLMALSFVVVPVLGWWTFSEQLTLGYAVGTLFIISGIVVITCLT